MIFSAAAGLARLHEAVWLIVLQGARLVRKSTEWSTRSMTMCGGCEDMLDSRSKHTNLRLEFTVE